MIKNPAAPQARSGFRFAKVSPYLYILPSLLLFIAFVFYPFARTMYLSMQLTDANGAVVSFQGLNNFTATLTNKDFLGSLVTTLTFSVIVVSGSILCGLVAAILANERFPLRALFRTVYAMPMAVSSACISVIMLFIMHPQIGILNYVLGTNIKWLKGAKYALPSVAAVTIWMNIGINFIFTIAALQSVDQSLYEAASIEGAGFFRKHWHVTLPGISPTLFFLLIINIINSFQAYGQIRLLTEGGPGKITQVIVYTIYLEAFTYNRVHMASAQSVILFLIILALTLVQFRLEKKVTY